MKKFLIIAIALVSMTIAKAQSVATEKDCCNKATTEKKCSGECKDHKDGVKCTKPEGQQCAKCKKANAELAAKEAAAKKCSGECKDHKDGVKCNKPEGQQCAKCKKANAKK